MHGATERLLREVRASTLCRAQLPLGPRPVFQFHPQAQILIAGQAPGRKVHERGGPFPDASGDRLCAWLEFGPKLLPLPHPSPRNNVWLKRNPWFEHELLPDLRERIRLILG